ncbi:MAG: FimV/HubP family polar landmark protein [Pseudomonadota bacterium]|nr:FimV/HubP family polar landmark protein [Pseudomonadota bacterium]
MTVSNFETYFHSYQDIKLERHGGILELTFGLDQTLIWAPKIRPQVASVFREIARDPDNKIVIITGFGDHFWRADEEESRSVYPVEDWQETSLLEILMKIPVPVIAAINGPVRQYCEIPLFSDVVLASENVEFQETQSNLAQSVADREVRRLALRSLLGLNRARYFLLTGKSMSVKEARKSGMVAEIMRRKDLLNRAREIAFMLTRRPSNELRQIRTSFLREIQRKIDDSLGGMRVWGTGQLETNKGLSESVERLEDSKGSVDVDSPLADISRKGEMSQQPPEEVESPPKVVAEVGWDTNWDGKNYDGFSLHGQDLDKIAQIEKDQNEGLSEDEDVDPSEDSSWESESRVAAGSIVSIEKDERQEGDTEENVSSVIKTVSAEGGENDVKLNLAKAYIELGYYPSARFILEEILEEGTAEQVSEAILLKEEIVESQS